MLNFVQVETRPQLNDARSLFREYESWLGLDLCFQGFEEELAALPGNYAMPDGRLYLAYSGAQPAGCIAMRRLDESICEMKRLYVRDRFRGVGLGNALVEKLITDARDAGYRAMRLDTYPERMAKAVQLYCLHGFSPIDPYYSNPHKGVLFMEKLL